MRQIESLPEFLRTLEERKAALGVTDDTYASLRNRGDRRTEEKQALLKAMRERAEKAGLQPFPANRS
jgi:hypothetical protein